jgi:hypothetical protein
MRLEQIVGNTHTRVRASICEAIDYNDDELPESENGPNQTTSARAIITSRKTRRMTSMPSADNSLTQRKGPPIIDAAVQSWMNHRNAKNTYA